MRAYKSVAAIAETFVFVYLGMAMLSNPNPNPHPPPHPSPHLALNLTLALALAPTLALALTRHGDGLLPHPIAHLFAQPAPRRPARLLRRQAALTHPTL